jgi:hypothetical protein
MDESGFFSCQIEDFVSISEVNKSVAVETEISCQNESNLVLSASFVQLDQVLSIVVIENNDALVVFRADFKFKST